MPRILFADDDLDQVTVHQKVLEAYGYQVETALTTADALRQLADRLPDVMVTDLRFPTVEAGLELVRDIGGRVPLIVQSGWPEDLYGRPEEKLITRIVMKGSVRELLATIKEVVG